MKLSRDGTHILGLDLGTTGAKAGLVSAAGAVTAEASVGYETSTPRPGWAEQDPLDWWDASAQAIRKVLAAGNVDPAAVAGVGLSGQMHGSVFLDGAGAVLRPCMIWCDQRTSDQCAKIRELVGDRHLAEWVGNPALPGFTAPKVLWLEENEPGSYRRVRHLLLPKDYINMRLTGDISTDVSDASGTLLFDVVNRSWSKHMTDRLGIPVEWLPGVLESGDAAGVVSAEAARATGLKEGTPVAAGGADNACGALGMGVLSPGRVAVSIGSSGTVLAPTGSPHVDPEMRLHSFCHAAPHTWYLMGVMLSAGLTLRWFRDEMGEPELSESEESGDDPYDLLVHTASRAPAGSEGLIFLPYLTGERTPHSDPFARGVLFGLDLTKTRSHVLRAVLEGITFGLKDSLLLISEAGLPLDSVVSGGGGSRSRFWVQMQSDVFELPIAAACSNDAAMLGAALLGGVAGGVYPSVEEAVGSAVGEGERLEPQAETFDAYRRSYGQYRRLYPALKPVFMREY